MSFANFVCLSVFSSFLWHWFQESINIVMDLPVSAGRFHRLWKKRGCVGEVEIALLVLFVLTSSPLQPLAWVLTFVKIFGTFGGRVLLILGKNNNVVLPFLLHPTWSLKVGVHFWKNNPLTNFDAVRQELLLSVPKWNIYTSFFWWNSEIVSNF